MQALIKVTLEFSRRGDDTGSSVEELNVGRQCTDIGPGQQAESGQEEQPHGRNKKDNFKWRSCTS